MGSGCRWQRLCLGVGAAGTGIRWLSCVSFGMVSPSGSFWGGMGHPAWFLCAWGGLSTESTGIHMGVRCRCCFAGQRGVERSWG